MIDVDPAKVRNWLGRFDEGPLSASEERDLLELVSTSLAVALLQQKATVNRFAASHSWCSACRQWVKNPLDHLPECIVNQVHDQTRTERGV